MHDIITNNHFNLLRTRQLPDVGGKLWEMEHAGTGAKLCWLERPDENMTFAIGFKTIPEDSTGVFHILEHSVLCGSDKYPVKEPFVELLKSSLQTFLNAMTFNDKTVYPVASRNRQDFLNLVSVYMDAVLHPTAVHKPEIFRQEGWRYEMGEEGTPFFQGVVYNEMKGAYADVRDVMSEAMDQRLFPDTCYRHDSGGNPEHIPDLTYEQFVAAHSTYYHPSNALIFLDGQVALEEVLPLLHSYLAPYDRQAQLFPIPLQQALPYQEAEVPYEIGAAEPAEGRTILSYGRIIGTYADQEDLFTAAILSDYLTGGSEGPLKRAILSAGLGTDAKVTLHDGTQQAWMGWEVWNTDKEKIPQIKELLRSTLTDMVEKGLDKERLEACCASFAFQQMDRDGMGWGRGLMEMLTVYTPWLYGGDPAQDLSFMATLEVLKTKVSTNYFEDKIRQWLLDESTGVLVVMTPSHTVGEEKLQREKARVDAEWAAMSAQEQQATGDLAAAIRQWQQTPDSEEALATIPVLALEDIPEDLKPLDVTVDKLEDVELLRHKVDSNLVYMDLLFNASDLSSEELPVLNLLCTMLGKLPTKAHDSARLQTLVKQKIGKLTYSADVYAPKGSTDRCRVNLSARAVCIASEKEATAQLVLEMLTATVFENKSLLLDVLRQNKTSLQMSLISGGNRYAISRACARMTAAGAAKEHLSGCEYISWINGCCEYDDAALEQLLGKLDAVADKVIRRGRMTLSISGNVDDALASQLIAGISQGEDCCQYGTCALLDPSREGILIPAGIGFAIKGANLAAYGKEFDGSVMVLSKILGLEHLWNAIRVQGGAYGANFSATTGGDMLFHTYRDPNPARSLGCFDQSAQVIREYCGRGGKLDKFILGAVTDADPLLSAAAKVTTAESNHFKGVTHEDDLRVYRQLLHTTADQILELCNTLDAIAQSENICVVGGQAQLDACGDKLSDIRQILA